jgi:hypothetical protein
MERACCWLCVLPLGIEIDVQYYARADGTVYVGGHKMYTCAVGCGI